VTQALKDRGRKVDVAFAPERIAEGHALEELGSLPQIIGADEEVAGDRAEALFARLGAEIIRTTSKEAELAKLFTNAWRYMKFAVANQFFMVAHDAGVDYNRVLDAIRTNYPRAKDLPGPGFAAGPCLLKDTMQLAAFTPDHFPLGQTAVQINEGLPAYVVSAMERRYGSLKGRSIGLLGMAFKGESDDIRSSLSYKVRKLLAWKGARVSCTDPFVADDRLVPLEQVLDDAEILVLGAPHRAYRSLEIGGRDVVDVWGVTGQGIRL
jgi:UDP-N-acetyl-D-mannosaminuronic acid dehydrogenase